MVSLSKRWSVVFLILPLLSIYYFGTLNFKPIILVWQCILIGIVFAINRYINTFNGWLIVYIVITLFSAIINKTITFGIFYSEIMLISLCIYIAFSIKEFKELIKGLYYLYSSVITINFILMVIFSNGISQTVDGFPIYLLGGKNSIQLIALPAISIVCLYSYNEYKKIKIVPAIIISTCILSMYFSNSGNGIALSIIIIVFILVHKKMAMPSFKIYFLTYVLVYFGLVVFRLQDVLLGNLIQNVLHKDLTFTGRTHIWDLILQNMKEFWLLGLGRGNKFVETYYYYNLHEAHNGFLEIMLSCGLVGLVAFLILVLLVQKKLDLYKKHIYSKILSFSIFAYMILGLTESIFNRIEFWILLVISYNIDKIIKQDDIKNDHN